jgi:hypothetical protein
MDLVRFPSSKKWHGSTGFTTYCGIGFYDRRRQVERLDRVPARFTTDPSGPMSDKDTCARCFE